MLSRSLDSLVKTLVNDDFEILKKQFPDEWEYLNKKLAYPNEYSNWTNDYEKPVDKLKKEDFFSKLNNACPSVKKMERIREIMKIFNIKNGEDLTRIYLKSDVILLADVFENFIKVSIGEIDINPPLCYFTWLDLSMWVKRY